MRNAFLFAICMAFILNTYSCQQRKEAIITDEIAGILLDTLFGEISLYIKNSENAYIDTIPRELIAVDSNTINVHYTYEKIDIANTFYRFDHHLIANSLLKYNPDLKIAFTDEKLSDDLSAVPDDFVEGRRDLLILVSNLYKQLKGNIYYFELVYVNTINWKRRSGGILEFFFELSNDGKLENVSIYHSE